MTMAMMIRQAVRMPGTQPSQNLQRKLQRSYQKATGAHVEVDGGHVVVEKRRS